MDARHVHSLADQVAAIQSILDPLTTAKSIQWTSVVGPNHIHITPEVEHLRDQSDALDNAMKALQDAEHYLRQYND